MRSKWASTHFGDERPVLTVPTKTRKSKKPVDLKVMQNMAQSWLLDYIATEDGFVDPLLQDVMMNTETLLRSLKSYHEAEDMKKEGVDDNYLWTDEGQERLRAWRKERMERGISPDPAWLAEEENAAKRAEKKAKAPTKRQQKETKKNGAKRKWADLEDGPGYERYVQMTVRVILPNTFAC